MQDPGGLIDLPRGFRYGYLPNNRSKTHGALLAGGRLQAMVIQGRPLYNADLGRTGERFQVTWVDVRAEEPHDDALAKGAARFQRLEGCHFAGGAFWFDDTSGGEKRHGQLFRLIPSGDPGGGGTDTLELFLEGDSAEQMDAPDNIIIAPWGDLLFAEDGDGGNRVMGVTSDGKAYEFANNRLNDSEFCGPCFSPDGRTLFLNIQDPGHTFAICARSRVRTPAGRERWRQLPHGTAGRPCCAPADARLRSSNRRGRQRASPASAATRLCVLVDGSPSMRI